MLVSLCASQRCRPFHIPYSKLGQTDPQLANTTTTSFATAEAAALPPAAPPFNAAAQMRLGNASYIGDVNGARAALDDGADANAGVLSWRGEMGGDAYPDDDCLAGEGLAGDGLPKLPTVAARPRAGIEVERPRLCSDLGRPQRQSPKLLAVMSIW